MPKTGQKQKGNSEIMKIILQRIENKIKTVLFSFLHMNIKYYATLDYKKYTLKMCNGIRFNACMKEPETVKWIESFQKDDIVYDIGASVGPYSLIASKYAKEVYAFEPAFFNFNVLERNIVYNSLKGFTENNITPINVALASKTSLGTFNYASLTSGSALHVLDSEIDYADNIFIPKFSQKILSLSLDDFVSYFNAPMPNHIKLDVDGIEYDILCGAKKMLQDARLKSILVEIGIGLNDEKIVKLLEENGFVLQEKTIRSEKTANYIFRRVKV